MLALCIVSIRVRAPRAAFIWWPLVLSLHAEVLLRASA